MMMIIVSSDIYKYFFSSLLCVSNKKPVESDLQSRNVRKVVMVEPLFCYYYIYDIERKREREGREKKK